MSSTSFAIRKLTPAIGAELTHLDLSKHLSDVFLQEIYDALIEYQVIFIRDQVISPALHLELAKSLGEPAPPHPIYPHVDGFENIVRLRNGPDNAPDTDGWHTDLTFRDNPPFASCLIAREVPQCGGDTLWASLSRAWETLSPGIQSELEDMNAVHDMGDFRNDFTHGHQSAEKLVQAHTTIGSAIHPVVKTHPVSGRKFLYVNESFTQHLVGLRATDSNKLLDFLFHHINQPEHQVRFQWTQGAVAIWDNRCTWHYATADYLPHSREMHRVTVINDHRLALQK